MKNLKEYLYKYHNNNYYSDDVSKLHRFYKKYDRNYSNMPEINSSSRYEYVDNKFSNKKQDKKDHIKIICCGDLMAEKVMTNLSQKSDGTYDFSNIFKYVKPIIQDSDFAIANLETLIVDEFPYTGELAVIDDTDRKKFNINAPNEYLNAVKEAGFDCVTVSNNHNIDWGQLGVEQTLKKLDEGNIINTGLFRSEDEDRYVIVNIKGINVAILAYSTWFNSNERRLTKLGQDVIINKYNKEKAARDISNAKSAGAEYIMIYMHWGIHSEYKYNESPRQKEIAHELVILGADVILGSHPHAVQGIEYIANENNVYVPIVYSMGNFSSSDYQDIVLDNIIISLDLYRKNGKIKTELTYLPCHIFRKFKNNEHYPIVPVNYDGNDMNLTEKNILTMCKRKMREVITRSKREDLINSKNKVTLKEVFDALLMNVPECFKSIQHNKLTNIAYRVNHTQKNGAVFIPKLHTKNLDVLIRKVLNNQPAVIFVTKQQYDQITIDGPIVMLDDFDEKLINVAQLVRGKYSQRIIAVTGSVGKTTTKDILYNVLGESFYLLKSFGNENLIGYILKNVQRLTDRQEVLIQEYGTWAKGVIPSAARAVRPDVCIINNINKSHMDNFDSLEEILEEKLALARSMIAGSPVFLNYDDELLRKANLRRYKVISIGIKNKDVDYSAQHIEYTKDGLSFNIVKGDESYPFTINSYGEHNIYNVLMAFAVGDYLGMSVKNIGKGLSKFEPQGIRQNIVNIGGYRLYLDCYNSSQVAFLNSVRTLSKIPIEEGGRKIVIMGEIGSLGNYSREIHTDIGKQLNKEEFDYMYCFGVNTKYTCKAAQEKGITNIEYCETKEDLIKKIKATVTRKDITLYKAGQYAIKMPPVIDEIYGTKFTYELEGYSLEYRNDGNMQYRLFGPILELNKYTGVSSEVIVPNLFENKAVRYIRGYAFEKQKTLEKIIISDNVVNIGMCAFYVCENLKEVKLPTSLKIIRRSAFNYCTSLKEIEIPSGTIHLEYRAFYECKKLEKIIVPETVGFIGKEVFAKCPKLTVYGVKGSYAHQYCLDNQIKFKEITE